MTNNEQQTTEDLQAWARQPGESGRWYARFLLFRDMGPNRSLLGAVNLEAQQKGTKRYNGSSPSWIEVSNKWHWRRRAEAWDAYLQAQEEEDAKRLLSSGLATSHRRVEALQEIAGALQQSFRGRDNTIHANFIDNKTLEQFRGVLDDIAKETGGRVKKQELTGKDGGAVTFNTTWGGAALEDEDNA